MAYQAFTKTNTGTGLVMDAHNQIAYAQFAQWFAVLDAHLKARHPQCVCVHADNTALLAVVLQYLLQHKINFYLAASTAGTACPSFCDVQVTLPLQAVGTPDGRYFNITPNAQYQPVAGAVTQQQQGLALLSTSGSTGASKFICYNQQKLIDNALNCVHRFGYSAGHRLLLTVPATHMFGLGVGLLPGLLAGATIKLIHKSNIIKLMQGVLGYQPNYALITPAICRMFMQLKKNMAGPCVYISAGEQLDALTAANFEQKVGAIVNLYGSSEFGAIAVSRPQPAIQARQKATWLQPLNGVAVKVASQGKGEILCKSPFAFEHYVDHTGLKIPRNTQGWYHTKDLGQANGPANGTINNQGRFIVLGRLDHCINRSGFLVALQEIELQLKVQLPQVGQAIAVANGPEGQVLAVVELRQGATDTGEALLAQARQHIERHLQPDAILVVAALEQLKNGKPDRLAIARKYAGNQQEVSLHV